MNIWLFANGAKIDIRRRQQALMELMITMLLGDYHIFRDGAANMLIGRRKQDSLYGYNGNNLLVGDREIIFFMAIQANTPGLAK